ncbi:MAG TPA: hypothetical protein VI140_05890 [Oxalicibacterium sp.]
MMNAAFKRMWGAPIVIGIVTAVGLIAALLGDDMWDVLSAVALAIPVVAAGWYGLARR